MKKEYAKYGTGDCLSLIGQIARPAQTGKLYELRYRIRGSLDVKYRLTKKRCFQKSGQLVKNDGYRLDYFLKLEEI